MQAIGLVYGLNQMSKVIRIGALLIAVSKVIAVIKNMRWGVTRRAYQNQFGTITVFQNANLAFFSRGWEMPFEQLIVAGEVVVQMW